MAAINLFNSHVNSCIDNTIVLLTICQVSNDLDIEDDFKMDFLNIVSTELGGQLDCIVTLQDIFDAFLKNDEVFSHELEYSLFGSIYRRRKGHDRFSELVNDPPRFWRVSGEHVDQFRRIVRDVGHLVIRPRHGRPGRCRSCILDLNNRILLVMMWLRQYASYAALGLEFNVNEDVIS